MATAGFLPRFAGMGATMTVSFFCIVEIIFIFIISECNSC
ncbi:membrane protein [Escherichia coli APEC IMT5155]|nr:hypothetical protein ECOK1_4495 [Escherichia coli IHE3034]AJB37270.1 membrane protein [Escherichia coli APEC IMT5155]EII94859.1 hypothetical protein ECTW07793_4217 [Escherichia coli TW07793]EKI34300.1 putative membrane protein [Escherichia coli 07798]KDT24520.1 putative membrane protein [Escherichia coli 2-052-05_S4_C1]KDX49417.1 putative membrane protein [Escherichia coli 2-177-06_S4_C1]